MLAMAWRLGLGHVHVEASRRPSVALNDVVRRFTIRLEEGLNEWLVER